MFYSINAILFCAFSGVFGALLHSWYILVVRTRRTKKFNLCLCICGLTISGTEFVRTYVQICGTPCVGRVSAVCRDGQTSQRVITLFRLTITLQPAYSAPLPFEAWFSEQIALRRVLFADAFTEE